MKSCKSDLPWTKIIGTETTYPNEIHVCQKVLATFAQFQEKNSVREPFSKVKIYESIQVMILNNRRKGDYLMQHEACPMSETSIRNIFGKFHAIRSPCVTKIPTFLEINR
jgi:hypothetical protein